MKEKKEQLFVFTLDQLNQMVNLLAEAPFKFVNPVVQVVQSGVPMERHLAMLEAEKKKDEKEESKTE